MIKRILDNKKLMELIKYFIFGVLTTIVGLGVYVLFNYILGEKLYLLTNIISWVIAVAFSFVTNKIWVFSSRSWQAKIVVREALSFAGARLFCLALEEGGLWLLIDILGIGTMKPFALFGFSISGNLIAKCITCVVVVIINYIFSKFVIFRKKKEETACETNEKQ